MATGSNALVPSGSARPNTDCEVFKAGRPSSGPSRRRSSSEESEVKRRAAGKLSSGSVSFLLI